MTKANFLHTAAMNDDAKTIDTLKLEDVIFLHAEDEVGRTPLNIANTYGKTAASIALMEKILELHAVAD